MPEIMTYTAEDLDAVLAALSVRNEWKVEQQTYRKVPLRREQMAEYLWHTMNDDYEIPNPEQALKKFTQAVARGEELLEEADFVETSRYGNSYQGDSLRTKLEPVDSGWAEGPAGYIAQSQQYVSWALRRKDAK